MLLAHALTLFETGENKDKCILPEGGYIPLNFRQIGRWHPRFNHWGEVAVRQTIAPLGFLFVCIRNLYCYMNETELRYNF